MNDLTELFRFSFMRINADNLSCDPCRALKSANVVRQFLLFSYTSDQHIRHSYLITCRRRPQRSSIIDLFVSMLTATSQLVTLVFPYQVMTFDQHASVIRPEPKKKPFKLKMGFEEYRCST